MLKNFKCSRCGECCNSPRLYKADIERIKKFGYKEDDFVYTDNLGISYIKDKKGWCMFLNKGKTAFCVVYGARPKICNQYPSELINWGCKPEKLAFDSYLEKRKH